MTSRVAGISGCVLAGGLGRRLGGVDKGLLMLGGQPLVAHVVARFAPQVDEVLISANRHLDDYRRHAPRVLVDTLTGAAGPLAGIAAALAVCTAPSLAIVPCDSPLLPLDLVQRLHAARTRAAAEIAVARTADGMQPMFALLDVALAPALAAYLGSGGRKVEAWYRRHALVEVDFEAEHAAFLNVNSPADLARAADLASAR